MSEPNTVASGPCGRKGLNSSKSIPSEEESEINNEVYGRGINNSMGKTEEIVSEIKKKKN